MRLEFVLSAGLVIATYTSTVQVEEIRSHFYSANFAPLEDIAVTTIDSFQVGKGVVTRLSRFSEL